MSLNNYPLFYSLISVDIHKLFIINLIGPNLNPNKQEGQFILSYDTDDLNR